ncbi:MAG: DUF1905 domain-containing protein [Chloroflexi bacterium]|nr:DUF1905 domain-containing protein [Chloroflexota bacterium]
MKRATAKRPTSQAVRPHQARPADSKATPTIRFSATLFRPAGADKGASWTFLTLPKQASAKLPSRSQVSVEGTLNGRAFRATLEPDGQGGHWLKVDAKIRKAAGLSDAVAANGAGDVVALEIAPVAPADEPEPTVPADLHKALAAAPEAAREVWADITPIARRDWIQWIVSAKQAETRSRRTTTACDMLAKGKRRPCCFDRSGMYAKSLRCPVPDRAASRAGPHEPDPHTP